MHSEKNVYVHLLIFNLPFSSVVSAFGPGVTMISLDVVFGTFTAWSSFLSKLASKNLS